MNDEDRERETVLFTVSAEVVQAAIAQVNSCEFCNPDAAEFPFEWQYSKAMPTTKDDNGDKNDGDGIGHVLNVTVDISWQYRRWSYLKGPRTDTVVESRRHR
jgi:hypothetical protein